MVYILADTRLRKAAARLCRQARLLPADTDRARTALQAASPGDVLLIRPSSFDPAALVQEGRARGLVVMLFATPADRAAPWLPYADVVVADFEETAALTGVRPTCEVHAALAVRAFYACGARGAVMTDDGIGAIVAVGREITYIDAPEDGGRAEGEVFAAALCDALDAGQDLVDAARAAVAVAAAESQSDTYGDAIGETKRKEDLIC